jgi:hypothetical protein
VERLQQLLAAVGEALAEGGGLGGHVVAAPGEHHRLVLGGALGEAGQGGDHPGPDELEGGPHLQLLDVLREVPRGHALVDVLVAGEGAELLDPSLDVVAGDPLPGVDRVEVDLVHDLPVGVDHVVADGQAEVALRLQHRDPQASLEHDLVGRGPDLGHLEAGVAAGEDVGDGGLHAGSGSLRSMSGGWVGGGGHGAPRPTCRDESGGRCRRPRSRGSNSALEHGQRSSTRVRWSNMEAASDGRTTAGGNAPPDPSRSRRTAIGRHEQDATSR